jgi:hypothetical protein
MYGPKLYSPPGGLPAVSVLWDAGALMRLGAPVKYLTLVTVKEYGVCTFDLGNPDPVSFL